MDALERQKRKIVSRLTGEVDIIYFDKGMDNKIAKLTYRDREIIIEKRSSGYVMFLRHEKDYTFDQDYFARMDKEEIIKEAKELIKNDEVW